MSPTALDEQVTPRIRKLDPGVVNKIAAGEVIERPASVVKELLDNSLDAGATRIDVDIVAGGSELIRVVDNGSGIHPDDLVLAVTSHATSKIHSADDLFHVRTYGFRGEALASIAEVSHLLIRSRQTDAERGCEVTVTAGEMASVVPCGCPTGTTIEIRQLFCSTPVRRKFMKTPGTEFSHIVEQFTRMALAQPAVHMTLTHNARTLFELPATTNLRERLKAFYGDELVAQLIPVESEFDGTRLTGFVGHPSLSKSTRKGQHLFLNGRWIQDRSLQHAIQEAYRGLLMVGRQPITFLYLELSPDGVDVNVHPTKIEVRFRDSQSHYRQILSTIRKTFLGMNLESRFRLSEETGDQGRSSSAARSSSGPTFSPYVAPSDIRPPSGPPKTSGYAPPAPLSRADHTGGESSMATPADRQRETVEWAKEAISHAREQSPSTRGNAPPARESGTGNWSTDLVKTLAPHALPSDSPPSTDDAAKVQAEAADQTTEATELPADSQQVFPPSGEMLWAADQLPAAEHQAIQVLDCYLVVETEGGLTVIDQHALHERIIYETLRPRVLAGTVESQRLLVPMPIELSPAGTALLVDHREVLSRLGFGIEDFGRNTILVTRYPVMLARSDWLQIVKDLADHLADAAQEPSRRDIIDHLLHRMSCRAAVKAGQKLTSEEIESLLAQRHYIDDAHHCPHGRPTALVLSRETLDRQFGRLG
ncbi:MAG: DNA mismatch repair endonuclease MutL [Planctomycetota bacterium]|nr:DNA mismatch repair endonuclease MutL [Planctomycetota bacterium]MDA1214300.1 DNA mismatch repair endonuclease MutL [Planctomycetota bacterium]